MANSKKITVAASKSYLQRALAISALAKGTTLLKNISWCADSIAAKNIIKGLGATVEENKSTLTITTTDLTFNEKEYTAGEAGLSIRMFSPMLALSNKEITFTGEGSLLTRPVQLIEGALTQLNVGIKTNNGLLPLTIKGKLTAGKITIDGSLSSQLLTGLLIALPLVEGDSEIHVDNLKSKPYIDMTLAIIQHFGVDVENENYKIFRIKGNQKYTATTYNIEGDWSGGAFFLVYGAVKNGIEITNLSYSSQQADKEIVTALRLAGATVLTDTNGTTAQESELKAFEFDATDFPDLFPPLVCLASQCVGTTKIKGTSRLTYKESNRAEVLKQEFKKMGIEISLEGDYMYITGGEIKACTIDSHNDHRIAMAGSIMNLFFAEEITVENSSAVNKSYPSFFEELSLLSS